MKKEWAYVVGCYVFWGGFPLFWNLLKDVNSLYLLGWRGLWAMVVVGVLLALNKDWKLLWHTLHDWRVTLRIAVAGILIYANWGMYIWCSTNGHRIDSSLAYYLTPLLAILLGMVFFGERLKMRQWLALGITLIGVAYTILVAGKVPWLAVILGGTFALYGAVKKPVKLPYQISLAIETMTIAPISVVLLLWCQQQGLQPEFSALGWRVALIPISGIVTIIPLALFAKGIPFISLTAVGMLQYMNPTLQMLMAILLGDVLTRDDCILFAFVWLGVLVYILPDVWLFYRKKGVQICE